MPAPLQPHRDQNGDEGGPGAHGGRILPDEADQRMDEQQRQDGGRQEASQGADEAVAAEQAGGHEGQGPQGEGDDGHHQDGGDGAPAGQHARFSGFFHDRPMQATTDSAMAASMA